VALEKPSMRLFCSASKWMRKIHGRKSHGLKQSAVQVVSPDGMGGKVNWGEYGGSSESDGKDGMLLRL